MGRWRNDVIVAMAMPAGACPTLQRRTAQSVDTTFRISQWWRIRKTIPVFRRWSGSPPKFNHLFTGPLPTFPENLHANPLGRFFRKVANKQTNNDENISSLAEVINGWAHVRATERGYVRGKCPTATNVLGHVLEGDTCLVALSGGGEGGECSDTGNWRES